MPKDKLHHCRATSGCSGMVGTGENCSKCTSYSPCENGCANYVLYAGTTCPRCKAISTSSIRYRWIDGYIVFIVEAARRLARAAAEREAAENA